MTCVMDACGKKSVAHRLCQKHYMRFWKHGDPTIVKKSVGRKPTYPETCGVPDCERPHKSRGYCNTHSSRFARHGNPLTLLNAPHGSGTVIDDGYVVVRDGSRRRLMHRVVLERHLNRPLLKSEHIHHINGNRADNRPENLEIWNTQQPSGQRVEDKLSWAHELIAQYEPEWIGGGC